MGYSSLIDVLTINEENRLRQKVKELSLREKDDIAVLKSQVNKLTAMLGKLITEKGAKLEQPLKTDVETYSTIYGVLQQQDNNEKRAKVLKASG